VAALLVASIYAFIANFTSSVIAPVLQLWFVAYPQEPKSFSDLSYLIAVSKCRAKSRASKSESA
jgi:hypothetical protein